MSFRSLVRLPAFDKKTKMLHAVIETPKRSPNKYSYDPDLGCFTLGKTLPEGMSFPSTSGSYPRRSATTATHSTSSCSWTFPP
jgi:inorganic pyrophosphatase